MLIEDLESIKIVCNLKAKHICLFKNVISRNIRGSLDLCSSKTYTCKFKVNVRESIRPLLYPFMLNPLLFTDKKELEVCINVPTTLIF